MASFLTTPASIPLQLANMLYLIILITGGTLAQAGAQNPDPIIAQYFHNPILWVTAWLPLPGVPCSLALLTWGLIARLATQSFSWAQVPSFITHMGVILLVLSALALTLTGQTGYLVATQGQPTSLWQQQPANPTTPPSAWPIIGQLPFTITLQQFQHQLHPGTGIPAAYTSILSVNSQPYPLTLTMNAPLRLQGYTLFQSSYLEEPGKPPISIITVSHQPFRMLPYVATLILAIGLGWRLAQRLPQLLTLTFLITMAATAGHTTPVPPCPVAHPLACQPVQHQGRVKPLLTAAHHLMPFITGQSLSPAQSLALLTQWLTHPGSTTQQPQFVITPTLQKALHLPPTTQHTYTLAPLLTAMQSQGMALLQSPATPQSLRQHIQTLADRLADAINLARTFALYRPIFTLSPPFQQALGLPITQANGSQLLTRIPSLTTIITQPKFAALAPQAITITQQLRALQPHTPNTLLTFIPPSNQASATWLTPWQWQSTSPHTPQQTQVLQHWLHTLQLNTTSTQPPPPSTLLIVQAYLTQYPPTQLGLIPLALGIIFLALTRWHKRCLPISKCMALSAWAIMTFHLILRSVIVGRPPVATLYESTLFIATAILTLMLVLARRHPSYLATGLILAFIILGLSHGLTDPSTDTLGVVTAVLNTRFWLAVHVLTITAGYALSLITGALAIYQLARPQRSQMQVLWPFLIASLLATGIGTLLGGVWADQSWGRFWGWDPKENGALILTLWLIIAAHVPHVPLTKNPRTTLQSLTHSLTASTAHRVRTFAGVLALTPVVVALSWFGVNLLSTGLHSYGFIQGISHALTLFCVTHTLCVIYLIHRHATHH